VIEEDELKLFFSLPGKLYKNIFTLPLIFDGPSRRYAVYFYSAADKAGYDNGRKVYFKTRRDLRMPHCYSSPPQVTVHETELNKEKKLRISEYLQQTKQGE
jgi:hypothetical protein